MVQSSDPLAMFFHVVLDELRKRLTPEEFQGLLEECGAEQEGQDVGAKTPTPGQTPSPDD